MEIPNFNRETNWHVITGSLSCGKTALINWLAFYNTYGYQIVPEAARVDIDQGISDGKTTEEIRADEMAWQIKVLKMKYDREERTPPQQLTFWDRGVPDTEAYWKMLSIEHKVEGWVNINYHDVRYKNIFLLERPPILIRDYARTEDELFAERLQGMLKSVYENLGYEVIAVPVMPVDQRGKFVLAKTGLILPE